MVIDMLVVGDIYSNTEADSNEVNIVWYIPDDIIEFFRFLNDNPDKITIIHSDAFNFLYSGVDLTKFDYCFADLWHSSNDIYMFFKTVAKISKLPA